MTLKTATLSKNTPQANAVFQRTILNLFKEQVKILQDHTAVTFQKQKISYKELDEKSNHLANQLLAQGVKPGMIIPVWLDRSSEWLTAIIGVLKTGAAYLPVDPAYPIKRVEYILEDAGTKIIITNTKNKGLLPADSKYDLVILDQLESLKAESDHFDKTHTNHLNETHTNYLDEPHCSLQELAYVIYTSGSTGKPKGVMVSHEAVKNLIIWHNHLFGVTQHSQLTLVAGLAFDISVWEVWSALCSGATLHIADQQQRSDAGSLVSFFLNKKITHGFVPTVLTPEFLNLSRTTELNKLKFLFTGGEKLKPVNVEGLSYQLIDYYGPTECTVFATFHPIHPARTDQNSSIGMPVGNIQAYILDANQHMLPEGSIGELCLSGAGLAKGYLNNQELTNEKFVPHPYKSGEKLYLTGDLAKWLPNGEIQFLGRKDKQVKIRGFRVELAEIEASVLSADSAIQDVAVITKGNSENNKYLIAFLVSENTALDINKIRQYLKDELPLYMIPAYFIPIQKIPLTENGKTNDTALEQIALQHVQEMVPSDPPENEMEELISKVWIKTLDRPVINRDDNFFDIGGDSLQVAVVAVSLSKELGIKVYLRDIYQYPVLKQLAESITNRTLQSASLPKEDVEPYVALQQDVFLHPEMEKFKDFDVSIMKNPADVLLTGATGFVGIHLLQELLETTSANIYCLVRAHDVAHATEKINDHFSRYLINIKDSQRKRIIPVIGDLTRANLGLEKKQYDILASTVQIIYHSGSSVNFIEPYSFMKAANVEGLREIIKLAAAEKTKCLVLLSTISVYSWGHVFTGKTVMKENDDITQNLMAVSKDIGYVRSKYVMEAIADLAAEKGLPLITYRLGYAMCHSTSGASAPYQWWAGLVKNCIEYGTYPQLKELREGLITVDYMTSAIGNISQNPEALGKKFNLIASPETNLTLQDFFDLLKEYYSFDLEGLSYKDWRKQWEDDSKNRLFPLTSLFKDNMHEGLSTVELYQDTYIWDQKNAADFLKNTSIKEPVFNKVLLDVYLKYLGIEVN